VIKVQNDASEEAKNSFVSKRMHKNALYKNNRDNV